MLIGLFRVSQEIVVALDKKTETPVNNKERLGMMSRSLLL